MLTEKKLLCCRQNMTILWCQEWCFKCEPEVAVSCQAAFSSKTAVLSLPLDIKNASSANRQEISTQYEKVHSGT